MVRQPVKRLEPHRCVLLVDPPATVSFRENLSPVLMEVILDELARTIWTLEDDTAYSLRGEVSHYIVSRYGDRFDIDDAGWVKDAYEVYVA